MGDNPNAFVTKLWSSTLDRNRAFFVFGFKDSSQAGAFFALFKAGAIMAGLLGKKPGKAVPEDGAEKKSVGGGNYSCGTEESDNNDKETSDVDELKPRPDAKSDGNDNDDNDDENDDDSNDGNYMVNESQALMSINLNL